MSYTKLDLLQDLADMGLTGQETILIHSSMKSIGPVDGGADTVLDLFPASCGKAAHSRADTDSHFVFDESNRINWTIYARNIAHHCGCSKPSLFTFRHYSTLADKLTAAFSVQTVCENCHHTAVQLSAIQTDASCDFVVILDTQYHFIK